MNNQTLLKTKKNRQFFNLAVHLHLYKTYCVQYVKSAYHVTS